MKGSDQHLTPHLSDDELIRLLYGIGDAGSHLAVCAECDARWAEMQQALGRTRAESAVEISTRRLAVQRQEILKRLEMPERRSYDRGWIPAAAAASLVAVALVLSLSSGSRSSGSRSSGSRSSGSRSSGPQSGVSAPQPAPAAAASAESDAELFTDVYSMERDVEPRAAAPIHALFQQTSFEPAAAAEEPITK